MSDCAWREDDILCRPIRLRLNRWLCCLAWLAVWPAMGWAEGPGKEVGDLDIDQLGKVRIVSTLTQTKERLIPAQSTTLDADTIQKSGARYLDELLDIYYPYGQLILHHSHVDHFGMRGIISDREDKYLLRVNGRTMNHRMYAGADSERDLPLLGDLREVTVIAGPASATYGAGAIAGVLNLETHNGMTFKGLDATFRQGFWDYFTAGEVRLGHQFSDQSGMFLYYGVADQPGASQNDSPYVFGKTFTTKNGTVVNAGEPVDIPVSNLRAAPYDRLKQKAHASYVYGPVEVWLRYTEGGVKSRPRRDTLATTTQPLTEDLGYTSFDRQFTTVVALKKELSDEFQIDAQLGYDYFLNIYDENPWRMARGEQDYTGRVIGRWTPNDAHALAVGLSYSHEIFNGPVAKGTPPPTDRWQTETVSLMAEHQWTLSEHWTTFISGRLDNHTYAEWLFSPRVAVVWTPTPRDTVKLIAARAMRRSGDAELRREYLVHGDDGDVESLQSIEWRYERILPKSWHAGVGVYVEDYRAIGFDQTLNQSASLGRYAIFGVEPELGWRSEKTRVTLSHTYTQLLGAQSTSAGQGISAMPRGYGHDLASWANHVTKLTLIQELSEKWSGSTSLRVYWGFPGAQDLAQWNADNGGTSSLALANPGYDQAFGPNVYWNAGLQYQATKQLLLRLDAYNMAGWFDQTLNKRNYILRGSEYSIESPALAVTVKWTF
ncbi:MAG: TonB-dependent receptor [Verrucomicrobiota bacterium]